MADYKTYDKLIKYLACRRSLPESTAKHFVDAFTDILFEAVTLDGVLCLFDILTFDVRDKINYCKTGDTLTLVRRAAHTCHLSPDATRSTFSECIRAYDSIVAEATAMALQCVNSLTGATEGVGFDDTSREAVLASIPSTAELAKIGTTRANGAPETTRANDDLAIAVRLRFHDLQPRLKITIIETDAWMRCVTECIIGLLAKYSECDLGIMGMLRAYHADAVEIRLSNMPLPIAMPRAVTVKWTPSCKLVQDARAKSKSGVGRKNSGQTEDEKIFNVLRQLLPINPQPDMVYGAGTAV